MRLVIRWPPSVNHGWRRVGDDGQIDCLFIERQPITPGGKVLVQVREIVS